eukprot:TRINITY_DN20898_c0_g1_i1.p1 TRINITY_DN20898_c0_g1~~TRINITY_DN20898_c0_g1_i1.p1  ORF type:complete len:360 (+),score=146.46 TRINITY_DN20898_c0_g1_i1:70-1080(+)
MAKVSSDGRIDGDPRWLVSERNDGANVNGWHWEERDISAAAKKLLSRTVSSVTILEQDNLALRLLQFRGGAKPEGEAMVLNRRKKVGVFFDLSFTLEWHGEITDPDGYESADAQGTVRVTEVDQNSIDSVPIEVQLESLRMPGTDRLLSQMREEGVPRLRGLLQHFYQQLRAEYDPRAAAEREQQRREREAALRAAEAAADEQRLREDAEVAAQAAAQGTQAPPSAVARDAGGDRCSAAEAAEAERAAAEAKTAAGRRAAEELELRRREEEAVRQRKEAREQERRAADEASRRRVEAAAEERRRAAEQRRLEAAARATPETKKRSDEELLDFITGD